MNLYPVGSSVLLSSAFQTTAGVPVDPSTVTLRVKDTLTNTEQIFTTSQLTHVSAGVFQYAIVCMKYGVWFYRFEGTGAAVAVQEGNFTVTSSQFPDYQP